ncbi:DUF6541 family protein [Bombiscardovia coagulans]|uniref:Transmembrane protein alanine and leucine rich n=1 Tax=Bombiscardovia coagulans TaxID=686666 RepID=A0A261EQ01_9BIFI|nr:DUF6541 family protein [Bombiscardovia coagulans]OZG48929.1 hypothetical protein BOCO_1165 [Bombiscardovia coagulans]
MNAGIIERLRRHPRYVVGICSLLGVSIAFAVVLMWLPKSSNMWTLPIHQLDAPSHYYSIRKLLRNGLSATFELYPNDAFYPPLFHVCVWALLKLSQLCGLQLSIFAGVNIIWLLASGILFPAGMLLWCSYFFHNIRLPYRAVLCVLIPVVSVSSVAHPYWYLSAGPILAYGFATCILPFLLYASLRLIDVLTDSAVRSRQSVFQWLTISIVLGVLVLLAHPRVAFTYLVFIIFFILLKFSWKLIASVFAFLGLAAGLFTWYVMHRDHGKNYFNPATWFHTYTPTRPLSESLTIFATNFLPGVAGLLMFVLVMFSVWSSLTLSAGRRKDGVALISSYLLTGAIYLSSASLTGPVANILTAAWYRVETRPLSMIPLAVLPLVTFGTSRCIAYIESDTAGKKLQWLASKTRRKGLALAWLCVLLVAVITANLANPTRDELRQQVETSTAPDSENPTEQLTPGKLRVLQAVYEQVEPDSVVISDPMNGSMYGMALYGMNMLYPVYNPMDTKNGKVFGQVEAAFNSGNRDQVLQTVCPVNPSYTSKQGSSIAQGPKYFLAMGPQAPSLQLFTYKAQYDPFHSQELIDSYIRSGTLIPVDSFAYEAPSGQQWQLLRFDCHKQQ